MSEFLKKITRSDIRHVLSIIIVLGCFVLLYIMTLKPVPPENKDLLNIVCGFIFGGGFGGVIGFFFGSSKGEQESKQVNEQKEQTKDQ